MFDQLALTVFSQFIVCDEVKLSVGESTPAVMRSAAPGPAPSTHLADRQTVWRIVIKPDLAIDEAYTRGKLRIDDDDPKRSYICSWQIPNIENPIGPVD